MIRGTISCLLTTLQLITFHLLPAVVLSFHPRCAPSNLQRSQLKWRVSGFASHSRKMGLSWSIMSLALRNSHRREYDLPSLSNCRREHKYQESALRRRRKSRRPMMRTKERTNVRAAKMIAPATTGSKATVDESLSPTLRSNSVECECICEIVLRPRNQVGVLRKLSAMQAQLTNLANSKVLKLPPRPGTRL